MNDFQNVKMQHAYDAIDPKGNIVLEQFEGTALLFMPQAVTPYCVAYAYNCETGDWQAGSYFSNLADAYERANPEILEDFTVRWKVSEVKQELEKAGIEPTAENVEIVMSGDEGFEIPSLRPETAAEILTDRICMLQDAGMLKQPVVERPAVRPVEPVRLNEQLKRREETAQFDNDRNAYHNSTLQPTAGLNQQVERVNR